MPSLWTSNLVRVIPVAKLNAGYLERIALDASQAVADPGGCPISLICDNCPTNQEVYDKFRGPGKMYFKCLGRFVYCVYN